ncbi:hypothetical protein [Helicobacter burdigaliensis]|nr:hypothetical protein [Helicobacter burdigaliensis]
MRQPKVTLASIQTAKHYEQSYRLTKDTLLSLQEAIKPRSSLRNLPL